MNLLMAYALAGSLGGAVGIVEIFQRYRAEPLSAAKTGWGLLYVAFNGLIGLVAFLVIDLSSSFDAETKGIELLQWSAAAGFGGAALRARHRTRARDRGPDLLGCDRP